MDHAYTIRSLNRLLANYFVLTMKLFRYEHFVKGEHAFSQATLFRTFRDNINNDMEALAVYITSNGGQPFATMIKCVKESSLEEATADDEEEEMLAQLIHDFSEINTQIDTICEESSAKVRHFLYSLQRKIQENRHSCQRMRI